MVHQIARSFNFHYQLPPRTLFDTQIYKMRHIYKRFRNDLFIYGCSCRLQQVFVLDKERKIDLILK